MGETNGDHLFAQSIVWLPSTDTQRAKSVTELIDCFYRYNNNKKVLQKGLNLPVSPPIKPSRRKIGNGHYIRNGNCQTLFGPVSGLSNI